MAASTGASPSVRDLFAFTGKSDLLFLSGATFASCVIATSRIALSVMLGKIFDIIASFASHKVDSREALRQVSFWCLILTGTGLAVFLANTAFIFFWILFSELQARNARLSLFSALLTFSNAWYEVLPNGTSSLLVGSQTYESYHRKLSITNNQ